MSRQDEESREAARAEQLLRSVRRAVTPTRADAARTFAGVEARLGFAIGAAPSPNSEAPAPASGGATSSAAARRGWQTLAQSFAQSFAQPLVKGVLVVVFGLGTGVLGYLLGRAGAGREPSALAAPPPSAPPLPSPAAPLPVSPAPLPSSPAALSPAAQPPSIAALRAEEPSSAAPAALAPHPDRPARADAQRRSARRSTSRAVLLRAPASTNDSGSALREALELLGRAEAALRSNDGLAARMWLSDLDRRAARELLLEERLVAATLASCLLADVAGARQTLHALEQVNPESMYRARLEGSCVGDFSRHRDSKIGSAGH